MTTAINPPYWGRAWTLTITPQATNEPVTITSGSDPYALRVTFSIEQAAFTKYWSADVALYNCRPAMVETLQAGDLVTLRAGYQSSPAAGLIFSGRVFQPLWERVDDTDYRLTLHCLVGLWEDWNGTVSTTIPAGTTYAQAVRLVAAAAKPERVVIDTIEDASMQTRYPRPFPVLGRARVYFDRVASECSLRCYQSYKGLCITSLSPQATTPLCSYAPPFSGPTGTETTSGITNYSLLGTPQQTEQGVEFRTLLDPTATIGTLIKLDNVVINRLPQQPLHRILWYDPDGLYVIAALRHSGDSRGTPWWTDFTGMVRTWDKTLRQNASPRPLS